MASIGVDELRTRTSEVLRRVREDGETIDVTDGGKIVARMVPVEQPRDEPEVEDSDAMLAWMRNMEPLIAELGKKWPKGVWAVEAVLHVRRDL